MARLAGYLSFGRVPPPDLLGRMARSFNLPGASIHKTWHLHDRPSFGLTLAAVGKAADDLHTKIAERDGRVFVFDGRFESFDTEALIDVPPDRRAADLAGRWTKYPADFAGRLRGPGVGLEFDPGRGTLTFFRDRFGGRALYYVWLDDILLFASEPKAILQWDRHAFPLNRRLLARYLTMNYRMWFGRGEIFFDRIVELPLAGHAVVDRDGVRTERYWAPPDRVSSEHASDEYYISTFRSALDASVDRALTRSKDRLFFVSGGLDAPVVAAVASARLGTPVDCCAAVFPSAPAYDESQYIRALVDRIGGRVHLYELDAGDFLRTFRCMLDRHDQPLISATYVLFYRLMALAAAEGYRSVFGGGGGDIATQGCLEYQPYVLADYRLQSPDIFEREVDAWCTRVGSHLRYWPGDKDAMRRKIDELVDLSSRGVIRNNADWIRVDRSLFGPAMAEVSVEAPSIGVRYNTYRQSRLAEEMFHQAIAGHFVEDVNAASFELEGFDPFWDLELIEAGFQLPARLILRDGWTKYLTRQATMDVLPPVLRLRPDKTGLGVPVGDWFREGPLADGFEGVLERARAHDDELIDLMHVEELFAAHRSREANHGDVLWRLFAYWSWAQRWLDGGAAR